MTIEAIKAAFEMTRGALSRLLMARISAVGSAGLCSLLALQLGCSQHLNSLGLLGEWDGEKGFGRGCSQCWVRHSQVKRAEHSPGEQSPAGSCLPHQTALYSNRIESIANLSASFGSAETFLNCINFMLLLLSSVERKWGLFGMTLLLQEPVCKTV